MCLMFSVREKRKQLFHIKTRSQERNRNPLLLALTLSFLPLTSRALSLRRGLTWPQAEAEKSLICDVLKLQLQIQTPRQCPIKDPTSMRASHETECNRRKAERKAERIVFLETSFHPNMVPFVASDRSVRSKARSPERSVLFLDIT